MCLDLLVLLFAYGLNQRLLYELQHLYAIIIKFAVKLTQQNKIISLNFNFKRSINRYIMFLTNLFGLSPAVLASKDDKQKKLTKSTIFLLAYSAHLNYLELKRTINVVPNPGKCGNIYNTYTYTLI